MNKDYDEVERFFKNPTYEGTSSTNTCTSTAAVVMYDTVGLPSKQTMIATENGHMYEALDKQDANGTNLYIGLNKRIMVFVRA